MRPWKLAETNYAYVKEHKFEVAVLPLGATEPHNLHLPLRHRHDRRGRRGRRDLRRGARAGRKVILLPTIPYGTETNQLAYPLSMNVNPSTLAAVIRDLVESLARHGIRKIVLLNSHGGNDLKPVLRELFGQTTAHLFLCNWSACWRTASAKSSTIRAITPARWKRRSSWPTGRSWWPARPKAGLAADDGATAETRFEAVNRGWVSITRPWHLLTTNTGSGNPHPATAEKGRRMMERLVERLSKFLVELSAAKRRREISVLSARARWPQSLTPRARRLPAR